ncbi:MAG: PPOX class F420-dependent oxidoreductase [Thermocrispum sp.]
MEQLREEKYVLLTTYRKNGKAVATPLWFATDPENDGKVYVWTPRDSGKVKRVRAGSRVEVVACDFSGKTTHGDPFTGTAELLDEAGTERVRRLLMRKYGLVGFLTVYGSILRGGRKRTLAIEITPSA